MIKAVKLKKRMQSAVISKQDGNIGYISLFAVVVLVILAITISQLTVRKLIYLKSNIDNAVILSALSSNVADVYQLYGSNYEDVSYATVEYTDANMLQGTGYSEVDSSNQKAAELALERFMHSLDTNLSCVDFSSDLTHFRLNQFPVADTSPLVKAVYMEDFTIYNIVRGVMYKVQKQDTGDFTVKILESFSDPDNEMVTDIDTSCLYVKLKVTAYSIAGTTIDFEIEELVCLDY